MSFDPGDIWEPTLEVRDSTGALTDATVSLAIIAPDGTSSTQTPTHTGLGTYRGSAVLTTTGRWEAVWTVSGTVTGVETQSAYVRRLGSNIISVADVKTRLNKTLTVDDAEIEAMLDAALAEYEEWVGPVGPGTQTFPAGLSQLVLRSQFATGLTSVTYGDGTSVDVSSLVLDNGIVGWGFGTTGQFNANSGSVTVVYTVGPVPANHREAIIADVAGYFDLTQSGPAGPDDGYALANRGTPIVLFPRIRALAVPAIA